MPRMLAGLILVVLLAAPLAAHAQAVEGRLVDDGTGEAVAQGRVALMRADGRVVGRARTEEDGTFRIAAAAAGVYRIRGERAGYAPSASGIFDLAAGEVVEVDLRLSAAPLQVEPLTITARRLPPRVAVLEQRGFYRRETRGLGRFVRRDQIERQANINLGQVLDRVSGVQIEHDRFGKQYIYFPRAQASRVHEGLCLPVLYVDGLRMEYSTGDLGLDINASVTPESVEALEVYRGVSEIPAEFNNGEAACGAIVIWTREGR